MKKAFFVVFLILVIFLTRSLSELHFNEINAVPGDVKMVRSSDIGDYAKAVLFEDETGAFGVAEIHKKYGFLYKFDGSTSGAMVEEGQPFKAIGIADDDDFLVAVKTAENSNIEYITLGNHMEGIKLSNKYDLSLNELPYII
ncbi:hypothetical protein [Aquibacillus kalidii]|uniref:hypothetical protein n=1 Tax=Aquibacillus kalidii TaxID=2762597 RepID=UPI0016483143|nr:hypothetical protein [Aquibacillus kalidii]